MRVQGWHPDPYGRHDDRWFSDGKPTRLVRDQGRESYDEPPPEYPRGPLWPDPAVLDEPQREQLRPSGNTGQDVAHDEPPRTQPEQGRTDFLPGMIPYKDPPRRRPAGSVAIALASVAVVAIAGGAFAVTTWPRSQTTAGSQPTAPSAQTTAGSQTTAPSARNTAGFHPTAQSPSGDAEQVTTAFLRAWSRGAISEAAGLTDDPAAAQAALTAYAQDLYLRGLTGTVVSSAPASASGSPGDAQTAGATAATPIGAV